MHIPPTVPPPVVALTPRDRAFDVSRDSAINVDKRQVDIIFATETPVLRYDWDIGEYYEVLSCTSQAADLSRLLSGGAFLSEHRRDQQIGVHRAASVGADKIGRATVEFGFSAKAEEEWKDVQAGIRSKTSVSYQPLSMVLQRTGSDTEPPTYLVDRWEALENSLVSVPADNRCQVGRAAAEAATPPPANAPRCQVTIPENLRSQHEQTMIRRNRSLSFHAPDDGSNTGGAAPALSAEERAKIVKEGQEAERTRCNGIREYITFFARGGVNCRAEAEKFITDGKSPEQFRAHIMSDAFKAEPIDVTVVDEPVPTGARHLGNRGQSSRTLTVGRSFVESKSLDGKTDFEAFKRSGFSGKYRAAVNGMFLGANQQPTIQNRAGFTSADLGAVNITTSQNLIALGVQRLTIMDLIAGGTMDGQGFLYPVENSFSPFAADGTGIAKGVPERGVKPEWEPDLGTDRADAVVIAVLMPVPKQFMEDFSAFSSYMDTRGKYLVDIETERQLLYGDGTQGVNLKGITTVPNIQTRALGGDTAYDAMAKALTDIQVYAQFEPDGYAIHPFDWEGLRLQKDANGQYIAGGPFYAPYGNGMLVKFSTLWGLPVAVTTSVKVGRPIAGAWKLGAQFFLRHGMEIEISDSHKDYFGRNMLAVRFEHRGAQAIYRPNCFEELSGFPART